MAGCERVATSDTGLVGGRPVPWLLGLPSPAIVAEPWSRIHALHRKKRGFSAVCARLEALAALVETPELQVWMDGEEPPDADLLAKIGRQIGYEIRVFDRAALVRAMADVERVISPQHTIHHNVLVASLALRSALNG